MTRRLSWAVCGALILRLLAAGECEAQQPYPPAVVVHSSGGQVLEQPFNIASPPLNGCNMEPCAKCCEEEPQPLTLCNFCTAGWNEDFTRRSSEDRAPDLALLRVQTNFMEREVRVNYFYESNIRNTKQSAIDSADAFIAYAFNRRFMFEVLANEQWVDGRGKTADNSGPAARLVGRMQLISTEDSSYSFNFQTITPDPGLGQHLTTISYGLAGFEDLTKRLGLYRVGLYYSVLFDSFDGPHAVGAKLDDVQYDITIAKTLTPPDMPLIGNFTIFAETFAQTDLDGTHSGTTLVTVTPGVRFNLGKIMGARFGIDNWIMGGVDIPVTGPKPYDAIYRLTYITNF
jgi:hypothetical protein